MGNSEGVLSVLQTCFWVCLIFSILFFIASVALFFIFDIRTIFNIRTGRAKRRTIKEMQEINSSTGRLRNSISAPQKKLNEKERQIYTQAPAQTQNAPVNQYASATAPAPAPAPALNTPIAPVASSAHNEESDNTVVLSSEEGQTTLLNNTQYIPETPSTSELGAAQEAAVSDNDKGIKFNVVREIMLIHTDEIIS